MSILGCYRIIYCWMIRKLNFWCGTPKQMSKLHIESIKVVMSNISPSISVRNLGILFDSHLTFDKHIAEVCKNAFYYLFNIRHIRKYLTCDCTEKIIHAFVTSRLDYCNSLFWGLPDTQFSKLQRVQNACARLIFNSSRYSRCSPLLNELHWLLVRQRIAFQVLLLT